MAYAPLDDLKDYLGIAGATTTDDNLLRDLLERATAAIDTHTGRTFEAETDTRYYEGNALGSDRRTLILGRDLLTISTNGLVNGDSDSTVIESTDYWLIDRNSGPPYYGIRLISDTTTSWEFDTDCWVSVTGTWGWAATPPADVTQACIRLASYYYHQKDAPIYETSVFPESGVISVPVGMPVDVRLILDPYKRRAG